MNQLLHVLPRDAAPGDLVPVDSRVKQRLQRVLRLSHGQRVLLADGLGHQQAAWFRGAAFEIADASAMVKPARPFLEVGVGLLKGDRFDWMVEKCVEAGADRIVPLALDHCVVRLDPKRAKQREQRWRDLACEAFEQCGRPTLTDIAPLTPLKAWLDQLEDVLICAGDETRPPISLSDLVRRHGPPHVAVVVGPEGGLSASERDLITTRGGHAVRFGPYVLRAETAAVVATALVRSS